MSLPNTLYSRLANDAGLSALVGTNIFPTTAQMNDVTELPYVIYDTQATPNNTLSGASTATEYAVTITATARKLAEVQTVLDATKTLLTDWHGGNVQWSFFTGETPAAPTGDNEGYSGQQTYQIWTTDATIITTPDSTGTITTGNDEITLSVCDNTLTLDCEGLTLNGEEIDAVQFGVGATGQIKTNQTSAGTTLGTVTGKMPVYNASGTLVGYLPVYDDIT